MHLKAVATVSDGDNSVSEIRKQPARMQTQATDTVNSNQQPLVSEPPKNK